MGIKIFSIDDDLVISAKFVCAKTNYKFAIENLVPLIGTLDIQRRIQDPKFYKRLEKDLIKGCIMPPLTIAFVRDYKKEIPQGDIEKFINRNIHTAFVLDGIQRLNTLSRTFDSSSALDVQCPLFLNIIICGSIDNLLYRMVTLNNGQKPMSARHQIEILAGSMYNFDDLGLPMQSEREEGDEKQRGAFKKADLIKAYIAFLSKTTNIDNQKIIVEKMDQLIAEKILDSHLSDGKIEFPVVIDLIMRFFGESTKLRQWFLNSNNLIGFAVGSQTSYKTLMRISAEEFEESLDLFERAFLAFNISKIKLSQQRRRLVGYFIGRFETLSDLTEIDLIDALSELS